jgi:hypothetical protein
VVGSPLGFPVASGCYLRDTSALSHRILGGQGVVASEDGLREGTWARASRGRLRPDPRGRCVTIGGSRVPAGDPRLRILRRRATQACQVGARAITSPLHRVSAHCGTGSQTRRHPRADDAGHRWESPRQVSSAGRTCLRGRKPEVPGCCPWPEAGHPQGFGGGCLVAGPSVTVERHSDELDMIHHRIVAYVSRSRHVMRSFADPAGSDAAGTTGRTRRHDIPVKRFSLSRARVAVLL